MATQNNNKDVLVGALIGGVLGTVAALLMAPKSGVALRKNFSDAYDTLGNKISQLAGYEEEPMVSTTMIAGGVTAAVLGTAAALLLTTKAGRNIRRELLETCEDWGSDGRKKVNRFLTNFEHKANAVKRTLKPARRR